MDTNLKFGDFEKKYSILENSSIVIIPVPYDETSSWIKGAKKGPYAILEASNYLEYYDIETKSEVYLQGIYTTKPVLKSQTPDQMVNSVYEEVLKYLKQDKFVVSIGGNHSISIGAIKAFTHYFNNITILQLDAHCDLRNEYMGSKYNHACVMARALECCNIVQVGIRSMDKEELKLINPEKIFYAHEYNSEKNELIINQLTENVYITIDLDVFDPSVVPSTGTPEPGGFFWNDVNNLLKSISKNSNIVGFDIVELCPNEIFKASDFLAAKLLYRLLSEIFVKYQ